MWIAEVQDYANAYGDKRYQPVVYEQDYLFVHHDKLGRPFIYDRDSGAEKYVLHSPQRLALVVGEYGSRWLDDAPTHNCDDFTPRTPVLMKRERAFRIARKEAIRRNKNDWSRQSERPANPYR